MQRSAGPGITYCPSVGAPQSRTNKQARKILTDTIFIGSNSLAVTELIVLQWITEGLLFDTEVVAGPDICNNFGHAPVGKVT